MQCKETLYHKRVVLISYLLLLLLLLFVKSTIAIYIYYCIYLEIKLGKKNIRCGIFKPPHGFIICRNKCAKNKYAG